MLDLVARVIVPLLTILFSGLLSAFITHRLSATRADREFRLKRLEEMFLSLDRFLTNYFATTSLPLIPIMAGKMSYDTVKGAVEKFRDPKAGEELKKVEMLVRIYFPELRHVYDALIKLRDKIGAEFIAPMHTTKVGSPEQFKAFTQAIQEFHTVTEQFKEEIFKIADETRPKSALLRFRILMGEQLSGW